MKLELKHLAGYLPYGLDFIRYEAMEIDRIGNQVIWSEGKYPFKTQLNAVTLNQFNYTTSKPILRPLSNLTKEIELNGEKFLPYVKSNYTLNCFNQMQRNGFEKNIWSYELTQILLEWHFDIYGLIESGLAIDINTLK